MIPSEEQVVSRETFISVINQAIAACLVIGDSTVRKLHKVAEESNLAAVGWFHVNGCSCPARQAHVSHRSFQSAYDLAMRQLFPDAGNRFVVRVEG